MSLPVVISRASLALCTFIGCAPDSLQNLVPAQDATNLSYIFKSISYL